MVTSVWQILVIILLVLTILDLVRSIGAVSRPLSILIVFLAALEAIMIFKFVTPPGSAGIGVWMAVLSTAIFCFSLERMRVAGGPRTASISLLLMLISFVQVLIALGLVNL